MLYKSEFTDGVEKMMMRPALFFAIDGFCSYSEMKKPHVTSLGVIPTGIRLVSIYPTSIL